MQHPGGHYMDNTASAPSSAAPSVAGSASAYSPANSVVQSHQNQHQNQHQNMNYSLPPRMLPDRNVDADSIEEAYVSFILACNPAVSPAVDTTALREAFRTPPRSDGRCFSIYVLYVLICELEDRIIKTWAELALKLGVEPPDQDKGQSSQKIQQYAVRLKRWMHSMHVNAFFDYLMGREHPYWTEIPSENYPIGEIPRDGVAAKDDMALRALIPEIKPRRGRKRDDDTDSEYSRDQRQRADYVDGWPAQNVAGSYGYASSQQLSPDGTMRASPPWGAGSDMSSVSHGGFWGGSGEDYKPPASSSPVSSGRRPGRRHGAKVVSSAWRSGGAGGSGKTRGRPPINRAGNHHAPSSTQDVSFPPVSVIERATPPFPPQTTSSYLPHMESTASISPLPASAIHPDLHAGGVSGVSGVSGISGISGGILPPPIPQPQPTYSGAIDPQFRGSRPSHLSLQVDGPGMMHVGMPQSVNQVNQVNQTVNNISLNSYGSHLGMPPNMEYMPNEMLHSPHPHPHQHQHQHPHHLAQHQHQHHLAQHSPLPIHPHPHQQHPQMSQTQTQTTTAPETPTYTSDPIDSTHKHGDGKNAYKDPVKSAPLYQSRFGSGSPNDRTNIDELEAFFMTEMFAATWYDEHDNKINPCSVEEATALVEIVINDLTKAATSKEDFLINLAALAGGKILMANTDVRVKRLERTAEYTKYECSWELRYGDVRGHFSIQEAVPHAHWKKLTDDVKAAVARACGLATAPANPIANPSNPSPPNLSPNIDTNPNTSSTQAQIPQSTPSTNAAFFNSGSDNSAFPIYDTAHFTGRFDSPVSGQIPDLGLGQAAASNYPPINFGLPPSAVPAGSAPPAADDAALAAYWERKYRHLLYLLYKRDQQLDRTRASVLRGLQDTYRDDDTFDI